MLNITSIDFWLLQILAEVPFRADYIFGVRYGKSYAKKSAVGTVQHIRASILDITIPSSDLFNSKFRLYPG